MVACVKKVKYTGFRPLLKFKNFNLYLRICKYPKKINGLHERQDVKIKVDII